MLAARDEPGDMRHVYKEKRPAGIGDATQTRKIERARISRCAGSDHRWLSFVGQFFEGVVIDLLGFLSHAVMRDLIKFAGKIRRMSVGEVTTVGEIHRQNLVAHFQHRKIDCHVGLRAAVWLDVYMFCAEQSLGSIDRKRFDGIDIFTAAVPAFTGITLGVFVGQHAALRFHHRAAGEIFRRDQLDVFALPFFFGDDCVINLRIDFAQTAARRAQTWFSRMRNIAHQISGSAAASPARAHGYFALFYKREHAGQGVFDGFRATIINIAPKSDRIGDIAPAGCAGFFKLAQQKSLVGGIWKKHLDRFDMRPSHGENMGRALD